MGVLLLFVLLFAMAFGIVLLFRKAIGERRWSSLMKHRRSGNR
jgi:hypothetical protein